jgi:hypothetical protein
MNHITHPRPPPSNPHGHTRVLQTPFRILRGVPLCHSAHCVAVLHCIASHNSMSVSYHCVAMCVWHSGDVGVAVPLLFNMRMVKSRTFHCYSESKCCKIVAMPSRTCGRGGTRLTPTHPLEAPSESHAHTPTRRAVAVFGFPQIGILTV